MNPVWHFLNGVPQIKAPVTFGALTITATTVTSTGTISSTGAITETSDVLGTTPTAGITTQNTTAAAAGAQQISPAFDWVGQGWKTDATAASQEVRFRADVLPVQGAANPTGTWKLGILVNAGAIQNLLAVSAAQFDITTGTTQWARFSDSDTGLTLGSGYGLALGATTATPDWKITRDSANLAVLDSGDSLRVASGYINITAGSFRLNTIPFVLTTAPTIASGFGTTPSIVASNGTAAFTVNVGTGGSASSGVITMPAATTGWIASVKNLTRLAANGADQTTVQTASTTTSITVQNQTVSTGAALAWTASDVLQISCIAY